ncbi:mechanosensitive ion channel [Altererythrobacter aurantiacus]|uniref:Mechanosensitive ion channel n=1 Tax=Parapontixanthobacter aurantiacus TaxID=1463599 RepID=A0A844ZAQ9_9SPHN|nr:mechanosensitive ion channel family protein [Parapontixanthobacter aurantiacus]MXO85641.1 mechanosensitive ion channel [Parapontixanthobacter aurantiacus]
MLDWIELHFRAQPEWLQTAIALGATVILAWLLHRLIFLSMIRLSRRSESKSDDVLLRGLFNPTRYAAIALAVVLVAGELPLLREAWDRIAGFVVPALVGWIAVAILRAFTHTMAMRADITVSDNLKARRKRTKLSLFNRLATFIILFITVGLMLLSIPGIRDIGLTLVASAGLAGLAVGAAAQPALRSLIAGVQMAVTEPINIDDVVIIEGEWGWIEDIRTTYVVVKIWDERRLIVPTAKFLEEAFQNWTKRHAQMLGTVFLYLDLTTKIGPIREEFERAVVEHPKWDGRVKVVQVTDTKRDAIEVRLLMSAKDSPTLFDLRCDMREHILEWIADRQPEAIARTRVVGEPDDEQRLLTMPAN